MLRNDTLEGGLVWLQAHHGALKVALGGSSAVSLQSRLRCPWSPAAVSSPGLDQFKASSVSVLLTGPSPWQVSHGSFTCCAVIGWWLGELALQEDSGDREALLLVDRLPQDVVIGHGLKARLLEQLSQEL